MGRDPRGAHGRVRPVARRRHPLVLGRAAREEFAEDVRHIGRESPTGAHTVLRAVHKALERLRSFPESAPVDPEARTVPRGTSARALAVGSFVVRYLYPMRTPHGRETVLIVSIRRAERLPTSDAEFLLRYAEEVARLRLERQR